MNKTSLKTLNHCTFNLQCHLVLVTKYRKNCIDKAMLTSLAEIFTRLCQQWQCQLMEFNGEADHIHLLLELNPKIMPCKWVNSLKTVSSRLIRKLYQAKLKTIFFKPVFWSRSYCLVSCGGASLKTLKDYIANQTSPKF